MLLELTTEQRAFADAVESFCRRECGTREQRDALTSATSATPGGGHAHSPELYRKVAELGWLGVGLPEADGGSGGGAVEMCLFLEETARAMAPLGGWTTSVIVGGTYARFGSDEQRAR